MSVGGSQREVVGVVTITGPNAKGYYKLKWIDADGQKRDTSGGTTIETARAKAINEAVRVSRAASPNAVMTMRDIIDEYLQEARSPYKKKRAWQKTQKNQIRRSLSRSIEGDGDLQAMDITREVLDRMRARGGTDNMVRTNTTALRGLLCWGYQSAAKYFTPEQAELLPRAGVRPAPSKPSRVRPQRDTGARHSGAGCDYVSNEDAPSAALVVELGHQLDRYFRTWGRLSVEFAANVGARWGEQFQLTAYDIHVDGCDSHPFWHVHIDFQIDAGAKAGSRTSRLTFPKGQKRRLVPIAKKSFTGYALREALQARRDAALAEQAAGDNPEALMFPSRKGLMLWHSAFSDVVRPAMRAAGWPFQEWEDEDGTTHFVHDLVWHSLRHRFARICVDDRGLPLGVLMAIGGWENQDTVNQRYYKSGKDNMNAAGKYFDD